MLYAPVITRNQRQVVADTLTVVTTNATTGGSHTHAITSSSTPAGTQVIVATNPDGGVFFGVDVLAVDVGNDNVGIGTLGGAAFFNVDVAARSVVAVSISGNTAKSQDILNVFDGGGAKVLNVYSDGRVRVDTTDGAYTIPAISANIDDIVIAGVNAGMSIVSSGIAQIGFVRSTGVGNPMTVAYNWSTARYTHTLPSGNQIDILNDEMQWIYSSSTGGVLNNALVINSRGTLGVDGGGALVFKGRNSSNDNTPMARIGSAWSDNNVVSYSAYTVFETVDNAGALTERMRIESGGDLKLSKANAVIYNNSGLVIQAASQDLSFYGGTPIAKPTITGNRGGIAALADLLTKLASLGLIVDSST